MTDLSSPQMQATFKKLRLTSIITNAAMGVATVVFTAIAVRVTINAPRTAGMSWAEILFLVLLGVIFACALAIAIFEIKLGKPYEYALHSFIAEGFYAHKAMLTGGGEAVYELMLAGDKLVIMRYGLSELAEFDLSPVKAYATVCAGTVKKAEKFLLQYFYLKGAELNFTDVTIKNSVKKKARVRTVLRGGQPVKNYSRGYFIKRGLIK